MVHAPSHWGQPGGEPLVSPGRCRRAVVGADAATTGQESKRGILTSSFDGKQWSPQRRKALRGPAGPGSRRFGAAILRRRAFGEGLRTLPAGAESSEIKLSGFSPALGTAFV
jgi:hypothetical protein